MSISRKSSFDTVVPEKAHDDLLQFLSNPGQFRKDLDLRGLSDVARKSFNALKPWQTAFQWCVVTCNAYLAPTIYLLLVVIFTRPFRRTLTRSLSASTNATPPSSRLWPLRRWAAHLPTMPRLCVILSLKQTHLRNVWTNYLPS